jgi:uncharacterized protein (DUF849 family)
MLQVALNGSRTRDEHPAIPRTPEELAAAARGAVEAGAHVLHLHAFDASGAETLAAEPCAAALLAVRAACPGIPVSLTTSAAIEPDPRRRLELIARWTELPDLVTANQSEAGIHELCEHLVGRGVGIEAGLLGLVDAQAFVASGHAGRCARVLVDPLDADPGEAVAHAAAMEEILVGAGSCSSRCTTATASPAGPSTRGRSRAGTASAPAWRTRPCCRTDSRRRTTPPSSERPPR